MLIHHIKGLEKATLAKMIYSEQRRNNWPGLAVEVSSVCAELCVEDANLTSMCKLSYKKLVEKACMQRTY